MNKSFRLMHFNIKLWSIFYLTFFRFDLFTSYCSGTYFLRFFLLALFKFDGGSSGHGLAFGTGESIVVFEESGGMQIQLLIKSKVVCYAYPISFIALAWCRGCVLKDRQIKVKNIKYKFLISIL